MHTEFIHRDPVTGRPVLIAAGREARPNDFQPTGAAAGCPFCPGNEAETPPEVYALRADGSAANTPGWRLRVVPNKFPAIGAPDAARSPALLANDTLLPAGGGGLHEVLVETPRHVASLSELTETEVAELLLAYRHRLWAARQTTGMRYAQIFKNVGAAAGASLSHAHSQLLTLPFVPPAIAAELAGAEQSFRAQGACVFCRLTAQGRQSGGWLVAENEAAAAICPPGSRFAYETWLLPVRHESAFEEIGEDSVEATARLLRNLIGRIEHATGKSAYNLVLHTAPFDMRPVEHYHWHIEIIPRLTNIAGFELGTGCYINSLAAEEAARRLRALGATRGA